MFGRRQEEARRMSDLPDRRRDDSEVRERLVAVEIELKQLPLVRERVHALIQCTQQLVSGMEDQGDTLKRLEHGQKELGDKAIESALASARAETQIAATVAAHIEHCKSDKMEEKEVLIRLERDRDQKHAENQLKINELSKKTEDLFWSAIKWVGGITGSFILLLFGVIGFLINNPQLLAHVK